MMPVSKIRVALLSALLLPAPLSAVEAGHLHHDLEVYFGPDLEIHVHDEIDLAGAVAPDGDGAYRFVLHGDLSIDADFTRGWRIEKAPGKVGAAFFGVNATTETVPERVPLQGWLLVPGPDAGRTVRLRYSGPIRHPVTMSGGDYQRGFAETPGTVGEEGAFLSGTTFWVPTFGDGLVTFDLSVSNLGHPAWTFVSQGAGSWERTRRGDTEYETARWICRNPVEEIYLVAGPWQRYLDRVGDVEIRAFLREDDPGLAARYLEATKRYIRMYEGMLTPYPWPSFSLVENFWDTGYGMPGFTLLGPRIIRFPWILTSSYPHEILHNWWGNSVYIDFREGNWCEGLTAYMADHLFAEQRGEDALHRRTTLQKYTDFAREEKDFPLAEFRSRHSAASEAVGYGKSLMLFHMIRREVGDEAFLAALSRFHRENLYRRASFSDLARAFGEETGAGARAFFEEWTTRAGAPEIEIASAEVTSAEAAPPAGVRARRRSPETASPETGWILDLRLRQAGPDRAFPLTVPVAVTLEGEEEARILAVRMTDKGEQARMEFPNRPLRLDVDPYFDAMRRLDPMEVPPALSALFGEEDPLFVLPAQAGPEETAAWKALAARWSGGKEPRAVLDSELKTLPDGGIWLLGRANRFRHHVTRPLADSLAGLKEIALGKGDVGLRIDRSLVLVARREGDPRAAVGWVAADKTAAVAGLARKLPHYSRYSYLAFKGDEPENTAKGMWTPESPPLTRNLAEGPLPELRLPPRPPLAEPPSRFDAASLMEAVQALSAPSMEGRGLGGPGLERATLWVEERLGELGLEPAGETAFRQSWTWTGGEPEREMTLTNLLARKPGTAYEYRHQPILVMAHLDHLGRGWPDVRSGNEGRIHPGADDNASGVAVLLAVARALAREPAGKRPVLFAVTTGEEAGLLGSRHLLASRPEGRLPFACLNVDTVGRLGEGKVLVLNADSAREWTFLFMGVQHTTGVPLAIVPEPLDSSDQTACLELGAPAVQLFAGPQGDYHRPTDTADQVDARGMARVAEAVLEAVTYLADREDPLTAAAPHTAAEEPKQEEQGGEMGSRRVQLGTVPDFSFGGPGVRVQEVLPGTPAEAAGIRPGDVLVSLGGSPVKNLKSYAVLLRAYEPAEEVEVVVERNGEALTLRAVLRAR